MKPVAVHDIADAEAFVRSCISRSSVIIHDRHEREELVAEGLVILLDLARKYVPQMEGYDRPGSFAGYASRFLPKKMGEAWHRMHPHHVQRTQPDGTRRYEYLQPATSLDSPRETPLDERSFRHVGEFVGVPTDVAA